MAELITTLGLGLLHFLWQGAVVWAAFVTAMYLLRSASADARYAFAWACLLVMVACPVITVSVLALADSGTPELHPISWLTVPNALVSLPFLVETALPWLVASWLMGVCWQFRSLRIEFVHLARLTRTRATKPPFAVLASLDGDCRSAGIQRRVTVRVSDLVPTPVSFGWLKPVILLPVSVLTGLDPVQLRLIILHELAHIRRWDFVLNLLQLVIEAMLFFHPAVQAVSRRIRSEREICCDCFVLGVADKPLHYARGLALVAELGGLQRPVNNQRLRMCATDSELLRRIESLFHTSSKARSRMAISINALTFALAIVMLVVLQTAGSIAVIGKNGLSPRDSQRVLAPTVPESVTRTRQASDLQPEAGGTRQVRFDGAGSVIIEKVSNGVEPQRMHGIPAERKSVRNRVPLTNIAPAIATAFFPAGIQVAKPVNGGVLIQSVEPEYPVSGWMRGHGDVVTAEFTVNVDGRVKDIAVASEMTRSRFKRSVRKALAQWRYEPLIRGGVAVEDRRSETFYFTRDRMMTAKLANCVAGSDVVWHCPDRDNKG